MTSNLPDDTPWHLLARHFAGELAEPEAAELRRWTDAAPERGELVAELARLWSAGDELRPTWDAESALRRIKEAPAGPARVIRLPAYYRDEELPAWRRAVRIGLRVAAAAALTAGVATVWRAGKPAPEPPATSEVATPRGQRAELRLPDGSQVVLGPASTLSYTLAREHGPRTVHLEGEAYFTVAHDEARPFTVHTAHGVATDLGTRFVVRAYPGDSVAAVVVTDGEVALRASATAPSADSLLLHPTDLGLVTAGGRLTAARGVDTTSYLAWTQGRLEFQDAPMSEVAAALERWYDLDVRLADAGLARKRLSASFKDEPVSQVLRLIEASLQVRIGRSGNVVTIGRP